MGYVDFQEVKRATTLQLVAEWLGLQPRNNRCQCPINQGDKRELVINTEKQLFYCFGCKVGGDLIKLASHINGVDQKLAAIAIQKHFTGYEPAKKGLPEGGLDYLLYEHEAVQNLGIAPERALQLGIGYANRGTMNKRILFPVRDTSGKLLGYLGVSPGADIKLPKNLVQS